MIIRLIEDNVPFYRITQIGNWIWLFDYETQKGEWNHIRDTYGPHRDSPDILARIYFKRNEAERRWA